MKRGVIYARYSCDKQSDNSTKAQIRECETWAKAQGIKVISTYTDEAISGRTDRRPGFQRMIADARMKLFDFIIVWKGDRFSRSRADAAKYKTELKRLGIRVLSATEANVEGPEAVLMDGINEAFAEYYSVELSAKVSRGMKQNVIEGRFNGGQVTFGYIYDRENKKMLAHPENSLIVKEIFELYVYKRMTANSIRTLMVKRGYRFSKGNIYTLLKNEKYIGIWRYQNVENKTFYPRIIDDELFEKAQAVTAENFKSKAHFKPRERFLLIGKAICGECREPLISTSGTGRRGNTFRYYTCPNAKRTKDWHLHNVPKEPLEDAVVKFVLDGLKSSSQVEEIIKAILENENQANPEAIQLSHDLARVETKINNFMAVIENGGDPTFLAKKLNDLSKEKDDIQFRLHKAQRSSNILTKEQLEALFEMIKSRDYTQEQNKLILINTFVNSVLVYDNGDIFITMNYRGADGLFLKSEVVRLQSGSVHQVKQMSKREGDSAPIKGIAVESPPFLCLWELLEI